MMYVSVWIDKKYLYLISSRLRNFRQKKESLYNCSCPFCGDSAKKSSNARGFIYPSKDNTGMIFYCHNCLHTTSFSKLLEFVDSEKSKEYMVEKFLGNKQKEEFISSTNVKSNLFLGCRKAIDLQSIDELPNSHYAKDYIIGRKIPIDYWSSIYYADDFKSFVRSEEH